MKPKDCEYKVLCTNLMTRYLFHFTIYESSTGREIDNVTNFGLAAGVVLDIINGLSVNSDGNLKPMLLSVGNFFKSFLLIDQCSLRSITIIGTLRAASSKEVIMEHSLWHKIVLILNQFIRLKDGIERKRSFSRLALFCPQI